MLTAEQKIRYALSGNPFTDPTFQHEGPDVVRWLTGGTEPDGYATFEHVGEIVIAHCPICRVELGSHDAYYGDDVGEQIAAIRRTAHAHQMEVHPK